MASTKWSRNNTALCRTIRAGYIAKFSTSSLSQANRAVVYKSTGDPSTVLSVLTFPSLPPPESQSVNIRFLLSPINPADINVVEGVYPAKPLHNHSLGGRALNEPVFVGGNEGLAEVTAIGSGVKDIQIGDRVIMATPQLGTWASARSVAAGDVIKAPAGVSRVHSATLTVNPPTAYNMIHDFVKLKEGDWLVQNGANSAVGQTVIQIAKLKGLNTLNFVRNRDDVESLKSHLVDLGATQVLTYDELEDKSIRDKVKQWTGGKQIQLMLNCVSGPSTTAMIRLLGKDAHVVSYGAMSKKPLSIPTSAFIFKNLTCHGFWQSRWYEQKTRVEREEMLRKLADIMGNLREPEHEIQTIPAGESDVDATTRIQGIIRKIAGGQYGKKVLLKMEEPTD